MINLHRYYKDNKDDINSSIMELACDLAAARLMNEHGQPFESFVEADDPDDPEVSLGCRRVIVGSSVGH